MVSLTLYNNVLFPGCSHVISVLINLPPNFTSLVIEILHKTYFLPTALFSLLYLRYVLYYEERKEWVVALKQPTTPSR